uniref:Putative fimbrial-associated protein genes n=1 Tax=Actinomyces naeslundii TaxID=1655 RepID=O05998_ACTNA|nr:orf6; putative fimbrial assoicated protein [Actinomyces naeslundii]
MPAAVVLVVTILVIGLVRGSHRRAVWAVVAVVGANLTTQILKYQFLWRPDFNITERWDNANTLPSGHTTMAASAAVALILLSGRRWRPLSAWAGGLFTVAMGYSHPRVPVAPPLRRPGRDLRARVLGRPRRSRRGLARPLVAARGDRGGELR